jgi:sugar/nucleoside kinase (ribokinase family)
MSTRTVDYRSWVERSRLVYSCNYFILRRLRGEIGPVFRYARALGALTAYDANAGDGWENERELRTLTERIYPATDIVFLNEDEARHLTGRRDPLAHIEGICPDAATVIVKLGPRGSVARHRGRVYRTGAFPLGGRARDTIGAGDSFQAAFLFFLLKKLPVELCLVLGTANAASTVMYRGGTQGQLDVKGLVSFIRKYRVADAGDGVMEIRER